MAKPRRYRGHTFRHRDHVPADLAGAVIFERSAAAPLDTVPHTDLTTRTIALRTDSVDETNRSVAATIATEAPVLVVDYNLRQIIEEILLMDGARIAARVPLLNNHYRFSLDDVLGSVRDSRTTGGEMEARLFFADGDELAERAWNKAKQGHLPDVSVGYRALESTDIPPGQSKVVAGKSYTAGARTKRVTTQWEVREVSLVPVGADPAAKIRQSADPLPAAIPAAQPEEVATVNKQLRAYLASLGMRADATDAQACEYWRTLSGAQRVAADSLATVTEPAPGTPAAPPAEPARGAIPGAVLPSPTVVATSAPGSVAPAPVPTADQIRQEGASLERRRLARIAELGVGVSPETVQRAIDEGLDEARFAPLFLQSLRDARPPAVGQAGHVGIHSRGHDTDCNLAALQGALLLREGVALDRPAFENPRLRSNERHLPDWLRRPVNDTVRQQAMDLAHRFDSLSLVDVCREAVRLDGGRVTHQRDEMIRAAVSGGALTAIFSTAVNAQLLASYVEAPDSTMGWVAEADVPDFKNDERASMGKFGALSKAARGQPANHLDLADSKETSKIARYSGQWVIDEMDIIDDRFGAIENMSPGEMGNSAAALRPDLIYAILLANAALDADSVALFHSTHANLHTNALSATNLEIGIATMGKQRIRGRSINPRPRYLLVPQDLRFSADIYLTSAQRFDGSSTGTAGGVKNPLAELGIVAVADDRLGVAGVTDPSSGTAYAGSATNWYLSGRPGEGGAKTLVCKYRRGTGRAPSIRSFALTQGQWGIGFDILLDIGADADDYRALYRGNV